MIHSANMIIALNASSPRDGDRDERQDFLAAEVDEKEEKAGGGGTGPWLASETGRFSSFLSKKRREVAWYRTIFSFFIGGEGICLC